jgi:hypothetical protein
MPAVRPHHTTSMSTLALKVPPPIAAAILAATMWLILSATVALPMPTMVRISLVILFAIAGAGFSLAGAIAFGRAKTTVNPMKLENASSLLVSGVYRISCDYRGHRPTVAPRHSDGTGRGACIYPARALRVLGSMAYVLIGGTAIGTMLTLAFLPALYAIWFRVSYMELNTSSIRVETFDGETTAV